MKYSNLPRSDGWRWDRYGSRNLMLVRLIYLTMLHMGDFRACSMHWTWKWIPLHLQDLAGRKNGFPQHVPSPSLYKWIRCSLELYVPVFCSINWWWESLCIHLIYGMAKNKLPVWSSNSKYVGNLPHEMDMYCMYFCLPVGSGITLIEGSLVTFRRGGSVSWACG